MGAPVEEEEKVEEPVLPNGNDLTITEKEAPPQEFITTTEENKEDSVVSNCCQGANGGFSCCRDETPEEVKNVLGSCNLSCWTGKWEQREILTATAVVGAVVVAYCFYKRSR